MHVIEMWFDGGCRGNPGYGYGSYWIKGVGFEKRGERVKLGDHVTSNEAEYLSLISALRESWSTLARAGLYPEICNLHIMTDSMLVANQVNSKWGTHKRHLRPLRDEVLSILSRFGQWSLKWHSRINSVAKFGH